MNQCTDVSGVHRRVHDVHPALKCGLKERERERAREKTLSDVSFHLDSSI